MLDFKSHLVKEILPSGLTTIRIHLPKTVTPHEWFDFYLLCGLFFIYFQNWPLISILLEN